MKNNSTFKVKSKFAIVVILLLGATITNAQVAPSAMSSAKVGAFLDFGGLRTHVINYTYNALGVDGGLFVQRSPLVGVEVRGSSYPMFARYSQSPITAGWRVEGYQSRFSVVRLSAYFGGGMSRSVDAGPHYVPLPATWSPCWQVSQSVTIGTGPLSWRPAEATFTETYTPQRSLRGFALTTGITYRFSSYRPRP